jgi:hypothetical protein
MIINFDLKKEYIKEWTLPRIFFTRGGSELEAYPLPSNLITITNA